MGAPVHATAVSYNNKAVLLRGASGTGKSGLALELMAYGAALIADDRVVLHARDGLLWAECPETLKGKVEARFVGLLAADPAGPAPVALVVEMGKVESERLPPRRFCEIDGLQIACLHKAETGSFAAAIVQYLKGGRCD